MAYIIRKYCSGDDSPDHGKRFNQLMDREKILRWIHQEITLESGTYYNKLHRFKEDYRMYPEEKEESDCFIVSWEDDPEVNEFGLVLP